MAKLNRATILGKIVGFFTTNGNGDITGAQLNEVQQDIIDSYPNFLDNEVGAQEYVSTRTYNIGEATVFEGQFFTANQNGITGAFDPAKWDLVDSTGSVLFSFPAWDNTTDFPTGTTVRRMGDLFTSTITPNIGNPPEVGFGWDIKGHSDGKSNNVWQAGFFKKNETVRHPRNNKLYEFKSSLPTGESLNIDVEIRTGLWLLVEGNTDQLLGPVLEFADSSQPVPNTPELDGDAYVLTNPSPTLVPTSIIWQAGTTVRYQYAGGTDLSSVPLVGNLIHEGAINASNDGVFAISAVNDGSDFIEVTNALRTDATDDELAATGTSFTSHLEWDGAKPTDHVTFNTADAKFYGTTPIEGALSYDEDLKEVLFYNGTVWKRITEQSVGEMHMQDNAIATVIGFIDTPVKMLGTFLVGCLTMEWSFATGTLTYTGPKRFFQIILSSAVTTAANKDITVYIAKNGVVDPALGISSKIGAGSDNRSVASSGIIELESGDTVEGWIENNSDATNITVIDINISLK